MAVAHRSPFHGPRLHVRRHPHPVADRAGRSAGRGAAVAAGLRRAAEAGGARSWPRRSRGRRCRRRPWCTRRICGWSDGEQAQHWNSRGHFFAAAAEAMRRILVDNARRKQRRKHGGDRQRVDLDADVRSPRDARRRPAGPRRGPRQARGRGPAAGRAGQAPLLRRADRSTRRPRRWAFRRAPPTATGPTPGPGCMQELDRRPDETSRFLQIRFVA